ncbi:hypothetical protein BV22DRAFT_1114153 [Leucogyrophana mollusca]|uniref:Uncharacterized protein n=1 Tax=Leucogyrophana mollusca TaxID=85980 RepID=A0ACB8BAI7_9AGAM|nr:hypothetical protein BV22DRAFT_1114153 [Leucogyrophana mollusca]
MSVNAHLPQSLPSFAQAFSTSSLSSIPSHNNALPPIQQHSYERTRHTHSPSSQSHSRQPSVEHTRSTRKRSREDPPATSVRGDSASDSGRQSPRVIRIKEEEDRDVQVTPPSPPQCEDMDQDSNPAPITQPSPKKRRVTVSGAPHPLNTNVRSPPLGGPGSTPISPVVMNLATGDDHAAREQVRSILTVKHQQKSLIEQRRGSAAGITPLAGQNAAGTNNTGNAGPAAVNSPPAVRLAASEVASAPRIGRRSPNTGPAISRSRTGNAIASSSQTGTARPLSPPPMVVPSQHALILGSSQPPAEASTSMSAAALPPASISFTRRRAAQSGGRKKKPADIMISPRGAHPSDPLAPVIQSAPPVPQGEAGRFPMALPRLPFTLAGSQPTRRVAGNVPPTPTRFGIPRTTGPAALPGPSASTLVPPTPSSLHHPGYVAPFEIFYDALNDSKKMKTWLGEQLQKSSALMQSLKQQQEKMDELVEDLVEKKTRVMREEIAGLHQRMEALEEALQASRAEGLGRIQGGGSVGYPQGLKYTQNGLPPGPEPPSTYRFPATAPIPEQRRPEFVRRVSSPGRTAERERAQSPPPSDSTRRMSVSSSRLDPLRQPLPDTLQPQGSYGTFSSQPVSHGRAGPVPSNSTRGTPPSRPQPIPERSPSSRQAEPRPPPRLYYPGSINNTSAAGAEGGSSSRSSDSHKNPAPEDR